MTPEPAGQQPVICEYLRTPFCKVYTDFEEVGAVELGTSVLSEIINRMEPEPSGIDEVILGNAGQPHDAANVARVIAVEAGVPENVPAHTVQRNCASGMEAIAAGARMIRTGEANLVLAGGVESMSEYPLLFSEQAQKKFQKLNRASSTLQTLSSLIKFRPGDFSPVVGLEEGLTDPTCDLNMGETAEVLAREWDITRQQQDEFALESHRRTTAAWEEGRLEEEVCPVFLPPDYETVVKKDNIFRPEQSMEALDKLHPVFDEEYGTVTPGNASPLTDGAAGMLLAGRKTASKLGLEPLGAIGAHVSAGLDPKRMGLGPTYATGKLLDRTGMELDEFELIEMNEAFSAQMIANFQAFEDEEFAREKLNRDEPLGAIDRDNLNVNGGAISIGHPIGATGTRLVGTLLMEMRRREIDTGLATLCIGGGQGSAMVVHRL